MLLTSFTWAFIWSLDMMHVIDAIWNLYPIDFGPTDILLSRSSIPFLFIAGLSLSELSERPPLTGTLRELIRIWVHRFTSLFNPSRKVRRLVAVGETVLKVKERTCYFWTAIAALHNIIRAEERGSTNLIMLRKSALN